MRKLLIFAVMVCVAIMSWSISYTEDAQAESQGEPQGEPPVCALPSTAATITVKQVGDSPVYEYTVTNNYTKTLFGFGLGSSQDGGMDISQKELYPLQYIYPEGWDGRTGGLEGGVLVYGFSVDFNHAHDLKYDDLKKLMIQPGATLSGFKLVMPQPLELMKELPYLAIFGIDDCSYGIVVEEK